MAYHIKIRLDEVSCADPETVVGPDVFTIIGGVVTSREAQSFALPERAMRSNESASHYQMIFDGVSDTPDFGLWFTAWDLDKNSQWKKAKKKIDQTKRLLDSGIGELVEKVTEEGAELANGIADYNLVTKIMKLAPGVVTKIVDGILSLDDDDLLSGYYQVHSLESPSTNETTSRLEVRFGHGQRGDYSSWDYSVFFAISCYEFAPSFGELPEHGTFQPAQKTLPAAWEGAWEGGDGISTSVFASITRSSEKPFLDVTIREVSDRADTTYTSTRVPISRVIVEAGSPILESDTSLNLARQVGSMPAVLQTGGGHGVGPGAEGFNKKTALFGVAVEAPAGGDAVNRLIIGEAVRYPVLARHQMGPDVLRLRGSGLLELYFEVDEKNKKLSSKLRYLRPAEVIWGSAGAEVVAELEHPAI